MYIWSITSLIHNFYINNIISLDVMISWKYHKQYQLDNLVPFYFPLLEKVWTALSPQVWVK